MFVRAAAMTSALRGAARAFTTASAAPVSRAVPLTVAATVGVAGLSLYSLPSVQLEGPRTIAGEYQTANERSFITVSYTHLTLPTIYSV